MKTAIASLLISTMLGGCAIGQHAYDNRQLDECRELPTPDERRTCERTVRDAASGIPVSAK